MCKVYIAGPITKDPDYKSKFTAVGAKLALLGLDPVDPTEAPEELTYKEYIDKGLAKLMNCDMICMLPESRGSKGAVVEFYYARAVGMPVLKAELEHGEWIISGYKGANPWPK